MLFLNTFKCLSYQLYTIVIYLVYPKIGNTPWGWVMDAMLT